jgi:O-antigen/teichoic acid export membrane protein
MLFMRLDQIMLEAIQGTASVGIFAVAARLSEAWYFVPVSLVASAFPRIIQARSDPRLYDSQISRLMVGLAALSYAAALGATLLSETVIHWLYGPSFVDSAAVLAVHIWSGLFVAFGQLSGAWLMAERRIVINLYRNLFGLIVNVPLNYLLIPRFGPVGAAWATLFSMFCGWYLFDLFHPKTRRMFVIKSHALLLMRAPVR